MYTSAALLPPFPPLFPAGSQLTKTNRVVFTLYIINKAGGLIYTRTLSPGLVALSSNDALVLAGTFHGIHAIARSLCPIPPAQLAPPCAAPAIFSPAPPPPPAPLAPAPTPTTATAAGTPSLPLSGTTTTGTSTSSFSSGGGGPRRKATATGIESLESGKFRLTVYQTPTGVKFLLFTSPEQAGVEALVRRCYEAYATRVMGNPFYSLEMPIRVDKFDREVGRALGGR